MALSVDTPRFPAASKKRGMERAIEIVEWHIAFHEAQATDAEAGGDKVLAAAWRSGICAYESVLKSLRSELR